MAPRDKSLHHGADDSQQAGGSPSVEVRQFSCPHPPLDEPCLQGHGTEMFKKGRLAREREPTNGHKCLSPAAAAVSMTETSS